MDPTTPGNAGSGDHTPTFTVSEIASALGVSRRAVSQQIDVCMVGVRPTRSVRGQAAAVYQVSELPEPMRLRLQSTATAQGFTQPTSFVSDFLSSRRVPWQPDIPKGRIPGRDLTRARLRARILGPILAAESASSIEQLAIEGAQQLRTGGAGDVCPRTVRRWIERAIERDRGFEQWHRWEIYLDDGIRPDVVAVAMGEHEAKAGPRIESAVSTMQAPSKPSAAELELLWIAAMEDADSLVQNGQSEKRARATLGGILWRTGVPISKTREALLKQFQRKRQTWLGSDRSVRSIRDARPSANRKRLWRLPEDDYGAILKWSLVFEALATGYRYARDNGLLSKATTDRFQAENADKSYVPHSIERDVGPELKRLLPYKQGPRAGRLAGPYIERDYSCIEPGDWWQSDDMTGVFQFYSATEDGGWDYFGQGQWLPMIDLRSLFILGFVLIASKSYTAAAIRSLITRCHDEHGLPRRGFYFERGLWERSRLLKGRSSDSEVPIEELELGLREFGLQFEHAHNPRAKVIECAFGKLQIKMQAIRGYSGRDARKDMPEHIRHQIAEVRAGREHPSAYFLEQGDLVAELTKICEEWNREKHGKRARILAGSSPADLYHARRTDDIVHLAEQDRYLLATHRFPTKVTRNGIKLPASFGGGTFASHELLNLRGEEVLAWVDVEDTSRLTVSDRNRERPFVVPRQDPLPAMGATPEQLRAAGSLQTAQIARANAVFKILGGGARAFRKVVADEASAQLAAQFKRRNDEFTQQKKEEVRLRKAAEKAELEISLAVIEAKEAEAMARGLLFPSPSVDLDRRLRSLELMRSAVSKGDGA